MAEAGDTAKSSGHKDSGHAALARKYRPSTFSELIGQEAMVQTLKNAFAADRIAQAYMLTGVRGVGKTTTARLIARGLNYETKEGDSGPTVEYSDEGEHCRAILEGRHLDVIEMDAASHTGIDDIRDIIDSAQYKPNTARYKVYIIDEVHMLSRQAFNGLLKTLEEPPAHVKFIFATTEVRKVPVTVLSRCQRFDLKRIDIEPLVAHLDYVAKSEDAQVDKPALNLIAKSAEGSVRDALSILDRAIAFAGGSLDLAQASALLGLADRGRIFDLLETVLKGDAGEALKQLDALNRDGAEPVQVISDLAEAVHTVTRAKAMGEEGRDASLPEAQADRAAELGGKLSMAVLARAWQMLLKGHEEVENAPRPLAAADMVLVRLAYAADLPSPGDLIKRLEQGEGAAPARGQSAPQGSASEGSRDPEPVAQAEAPPAESENPAPPDVAFDPGPEPQSAPEPESIEANADPRSFEEIVQLAEDRRDLLLKNALMEKVRLVSFRPGSIEINLQPDAHKELTQELSRALKRWTGRAWGVVVTNEKEGDITLGEKRRRERDAELARVKEHPAVKEVFERFPDAKIKAVRPLSSGEPAPADDALSDEAPTDEPLTDEPWEDGSDFDNNDDFPDRRMSEDGRKR
ncbi:DNA polymerase III subunit gamma/tau [Methyloligella solikamskensis]|uniref:DNA polymerase III subunit gamma/tau n=1 Tax=Methyloligella solikamskensis TaxID=1177756 RepID=A0ABW3JEY5_9HYPH